MKAGRSLLTGCTKGIPAGAELSSLDEVGKQGWNVLSGDLPLPLLVVKRAAIDHNVDLMQRYCDARGVHLAPHGKTTMCPDIWQAQLARGAWGISVATTHQALVCFASGVKRAVLANEEVAPAHLDWLARALADDQDRELYLWVDSPEGVDALAAAHGRVGMETSWRVLIEIGWASGRTGVRDDRTLDSVLGTLGRWAGRVQLVGLAVFEGLLHRPHPVGSTRAAEIDQSAVQAILDRVVATAGRLVAEGRLSEDLILSGGGSKTFDAVVDTFRAALPAAKVVLRSGCYVAHDHGNDARLSPLGSLADTELTRTLGHLRPALELWAYVISIPEPGLALLGFGRRDVSFDAGLPNPVAHVPAGTAIPYSWVSGEIVELNDQHAYLRFSDDRLRIGDRVVCGVSHPCTALDKWRFLPLVDDEYNVVAGLPTFF